MALSVTCGPILMRNARRFLAVRLHFVFALGVITIDSLIARTSHSAARKEDASLFFLDAKRGREQRGSLSISLLLLLRLIVTSTKVSSRFLPN